MRVAIEIFTEVDDQTSVVEKIASITKYIVEMGFRVVYSSRPFTKVPW
jgi:hypothetical protein